MFGHAVNLRGVEHMGLFKERYGAGFLIPRFGGFGLDELVGVDDGGPFLAFPYVRAQFQGRLEAEPVRGTATALLGILSAGTEQLFSVTLPFQIHPRFPDFLLPRSP